MAKPRKQVHSEPPAPPIFTVRGQRVILDADLARIYGVPTYVFNQAVKRNLDRFPEDFAFQLTAAEVANLRSQIAMSSNRSQFVTSPAKHGGRRHRLWTSSEGE
jgi:hypothetical protein